MFYPHKYIFQEDGTSGTLFMQHWNAYSKENYVMFI
jgi:hypothetical protein